MRSRKATLRIPLADWVRLCIHLLTFGTALLNFLAQ